MAQSTSSKDNDIQIIDDDNEIIKMTQPASNYCDLERYDVPEKITNNHIQKVCKIIVNKSGEIKGWTLVTSTTDSGKTDKSPTKMCHSFTYQITIQDHETRPGYPAFDGSVRCSGKRFKEFYKKFGASNKKEMIDY